MRRLRCPYCKHEFELAPEGGKCPSCGKQMRLPPGIGKSAVNLRERKRKTEKIHREADARLKTRQATPDIRPGRNPKILFAVGATFIVLTALFIKRDQEAAETPHNSPYTKVVTDLQILSQALGRFEAHVGRYPTLEEGLYSLVDGRQIEGWRGSYIKMLYADSWNSSYNYSLSNDIAVVFSSGPDKTTNTTDDVYSNPLDLDPGTDWIKTYRRPYVNVNQLP